MRVIAILCMLAAVIPAAADDLSEARKVFEPPPARAIVGALTPTLTVVQGYVRLMQSASAKKAPAVDDPNRCVDPATRAKVGKARLCLSFYLLPFSLTGP